MRISWRIDSILPEFCLQRVCKRDGKRERGQWKDMRERPLMVVY